MGVPLQLEADEYRAEVRASDCTRCDKVMQYMVDMFGDCQEMTDVHKPGVR